MNYQLQQFNNTLFGNKIVENWYRYILVLIIVQVFYLFKDKSFILFQI